MKKIKFILVIVLLLISIFTLTACTKKADQKYCDKINNAIAEGNPLTYEQIKKDLGKTTNDSLENFELQTGYAIWYTGYKSYDDAKKAMEKGKEVNCLVVYFVDKVSVRAEYVPLNQEK